MTVPLTPEQVEQAEKEWNGRTGPSAEVYALRWVPLLLSSLKAAQEETKGLLQLLRSTNREDEAVIREREVALKIVRSERDALAARVKELEAEQTRERQQDNRTIQIAAKAIDGLRDKIKELEAEVERLKR